MAMGWAERGLNREPSYARDLRPRRNRLTFGGKRLVRLPISSVDDSGFRWLGPVAQEKLKSTTGATWAGRSSKPPDGGAYPGAHTQTDVLPRNTYNDRQSSLAVEADG
jgi:hypothetical protein